MQKRKSDYLYVATDGVAAKIGIAASPPDRMRNVGRGVKLLKSWYMPGGVAAGFESYIKDHFRPIRNRATEWFNIAPQELIDFVEAKRPRCTKKVGDEWVEVPYGQSAR